MPYDPNTYPSYASGDPFAQGFANAQLIRNAAMYAQAQREALDRVRVKTQRDQLTDDLEQRLMMQDRGATPVGPGGTVPISGRIADYGAPTAPGLPDMSIASRVMNAGSDYAGTAPADPSRVVKVANGDQYQLPTADEAEDLAEKKAARKALGDPRNRPVKVTGDLAKYTGVEDGTEVPLSEYVPMVQRATAAKREEEARARDQMRQELQTRQQEERERHNQEQEAIGNRNAASSERRASAIEARVEQAGGGAGKPPSSAKLLPIEVRKRQAMQKAEDRYTKAMRAAKLGGKVDPAAAQDALDQLRTDKQNAQDLYETALSQLGVPVDHLDVNDAAPAAPKAAPAGTAPQQSAPAPAAPPAVAPQQNAVPVAAPSTAPQEKSASPAKRGTAQSSTKPPSDVIAKIPPGKIATMRNGQRWLKNPDGTVSEVR